MRQPNLRQQTKIALTFTIITAIALGAAAFMFYRHVHSIALDDARATMHDVSGSISTRLDTEILALDRIALGVIGNKGLTDALAQLSLLVPGQVDSLLLRKYEFQKILDSLIFSLNTPVLISPMISIIRPDQGDYFGWSIHGADIKTQQHVLRGLPWLEEVKVAQGARVLLSPRQNELSPRHEIVFSIARALVTPKNKLLGYLEVQQSYQTLIDAFTVANESFHSVLFDETGSQIYQSRDSETQMPVHYSQIGSQPEGQFWYESKGEFYLYAAHQSPYTHWTTVLLRPFSEVFRTSGAAFKLVLYAILGVLCVSLGVILLMSWRLTNPIRRLRASVEAIDLVHPKLALEDAGDDEIQLLQLSFARMMERLDASIQQQTQMQLAEMRAYMMALQSQMTPHFLYNTLNTIASMADESGKELIVSACRGLCRMLRYSSDYEHPKASLADELIHAAQYLSLLKYRFENGLVFTTQTDGPVDTIEVPRLILQPLVENSYKHGLSRISPPWQVTVRVRAWEDNSFQATVTDNGLGFAREALESLMKQIDMIRKCQLTAQQLRCLNCKHVGLINTFSRLYLEYGSTAQLTVISNQPGNCTVEISVRRGAMA